MRYSSLLSRETPEIAGYLSFNGGPSVAEASIQDQEVQQAAAQRLEALRTANSELFKTEVSEVTAEVGAQILKATGDGDEAQALQAVIGSFVASSALDLGMSPKQFWQDYGARILGEPDVKRDSKGNLTEVEGKSPAQWKNDAFSQSWGSLEKVKQFIVRGAELVYKLAPTSREEVENRLAGLIGKKLTFSDGHSASFSKASLRKMLSGKAVAKSSSPEVHNFVLSNIEQVARKAILGWKKPDTKEGNLKDVKRYFSAIECEGSTYLAKITVKSYSDVKTEDKAYSIESVEVHSFEEAQFWVEKNAQADEYEKPVDPTQDTTGGGCVDD